MADAQSDNQSNGRRGWSWFDRAEDIQPEEAVQAEGLPDPGRELRTAYARCFSSPDGEKVLAHLRALTLERALGPDATASMLRHIEGQRQLVSYIASQCERGRKGG